ncbi:unnamed protein product [Mycena citricolor]|uniref:Uncharacterized protein n=1 Tax=Mycena citricolor TaxID=2018698 RepID=A0AAD2JV29_9AGAR|nr:unnamed protein product [Mycena citricolor]
MAGSNSNLLEEKDRVRRQLSVLRAIWAICAFSLHTGSPLQSPIGEANVRNALLGSKLHASPDVQNMVPAVSALIRLNVVESRSRDEAFTQRSNSDAEAERQRHADIHRTYTDYLQAHSKRTASFQRDVTISLFYRSQMRFTEVDGYKTLLNALHELIDSALEKTAEETADNVVFAARQMIAPFAQISKYPYPSVLRLGPLLVRHPSLAATEPEFDSKHHYTRFLCHMLCDNLVFRSNPQECVDALQLIYRKLLQSDEPPTDLETHLLVLRRLQTKATNLCMHRLAAIVQSVVLKSCKEDSSEWERLPSIFDDEEWFRSVFGLDNDERTERVSGQQFYDCVRVGVWTTFLEQCTTQSPDQTERDQDFATLGLVKRYTELPIFSAIPTGLQRRFADAAAAFIRKYPNNCLADENGLDSVLFWAGWMTDLDALRVVYVALMEVQTDDQQESHWKHAQRIRGEIQNRLPPEDSPAESVPLVSDGEWSSNRRGCHFPLI